jgi:hypothetical protein
MEISFYLHRCAFFELAVLVGWAGFRLQPATRVSSHSGMGTSRFVFTPEAEEEILELYRWVAAAGSLEVAAR